MVSDTPAHKHDKSRCTLQPLTHSPRRLLLPCLQSWSWCRNDTHGPVWDVFDLFLLCRDAWNSLGDMVKEEAMQAYVDEMKLVGFLRVFLIIIMPFLGKIGKPGVVS